ncbi:AgmX/PglI C-terminal domain-containing protein [Catenovulum sp. SX2]|uniref:AgmX/PglI C-terminal domain-containing protein n=1 Tax=Catenovulum sp. SX2 TaxID=3398614 RepID=UPI003F876B11
MATASMQMESQWLANGGYSDKLFKQILAVLFIGYFVLAVGVPIIEVPELTREQQTRLPPQLAKVVLDKKVPPKPEPKPKETVEEKPREPTPVEKKQAAKAAAKKVAQKAGLAAMKDSLFALRDAVKVEQTKQPLKQGKQTQTEFKRDMLDAAAGKKAASMQQAQVAKVDAAEQTEAVPNQQMRLAENEQLQDLGLYGNDEANIAEETSEGGELASRSEQEIRQTLEAHKASLYQIYNKALRKNPLLAGKVVFEMLVTSTGEISQVSIVSSELNDAKLERRLVLKLRGIQFASKEVADTATQWTIEFLPS